MNKTDTTELATVISAATALTTAGEGGVENPHLRKILYFCQMILTVKCQKAVYCFSLENREFRVLEKLKNMA